ncbi:MAG: 4-hydroxythreonine-4-phosphate dehydrogenase PdxA [Candidatus Binatia bacterium]
MSKDRAVAEPVVAVTMGDPAGVGPEVVLKALESTAVRRICRPLVIGDWGVLERTQALLRTGLNTKRPPYELVPSAPGEPVSPRKGVVSVYSVSSLSMAQSRPGRPVAACGEAAYCYIREAAQLVMSGVADAMATAPISKRVLHLSGHRYPGHTELLAELTGAREVRMMLVGRRLRVVLVTVHVPYTQVAGALTRERIETTIKLSHVALRRQFGISNPRLAVAALNPHAGEEGIFGDEEIKVILPAIERARKRGIRVYGPFPADTIFHRAVQGSYDAVVCMYHDQGLIPLKLLHFFGGAALTLGLPIVRTSVDHGTAYDIAGKNKADGSSMREAVVLAARLAPTKKRGGEER